MARSTVLNIVQSLAESDAAIRMLLERLYIARARGPGQTESQAPLRKDPGALGDFSTSLLMLSIVLMNLQGAEHRVTTDVLLVALPDSDLEQA